MIGRRTRASDLPEVLALYRELRPQDPALGSQRATQLWAAVNSFPESLIVVVENGGQIGSTCMLAFISNLANGGRPIGIIEHVITGAAFRRRAWQKHACNLP